MEEANKPQEPHFQPDSNTSSHIAFDVVTISVRISEKQKAALRKHGRISEAVKEAIDLYLSSKRSEQTLKKLKALQRTGTVKTTAQKEVELINEDRRVR